MNYYFVKPAKHMCQEFVKSRYSVTSATIPNKKTSSPQKMNKLYTFIALVFAATISNAQTPFERVYTILNTKCQNGNCHSSTATDGSQALLFTGTENDVYNAIYEVTPGNTTSVGKHEKLVKAGHPYMSFLLRKIAGSGFDTDLSLDAGEGDLMKDINNTALTTKEIEFVRQWIMFSAKQTYGTNEAKPDWQTVSDYYDNPTLPFLPKPAKPAAGTGLQFRMGPVFVPVTGASEQEWCLQQEVNFPYLPQVDRIDGFMNQQSHHFLLFKFQDSASAVDRGLGMYKISITGGTTSFDGSKQLTSAWQDDAEFHLPTGTALFWDQKTYLDMNYHIKNYAATDVLPCDFYYNIYFEPRNPGTIEMKANLVNNVGLFLTQGTQTRDYDDETNNDAKQWKYIWALTSHAHKYGSDYDIYIRDTTGTITDKIYEGFYDYANNYDKGYYDWEHPSTEYFPSFLPVKFGKHGSKNAGLVARTTWDVQQPFITFGFTTNDEMQLFYYFYTSQLPDGVNAINDEKSKQIFFQVMPNPMNGNGRLVYQLDAAAKVEASVVDITGKTVAQLTEENQTEGLHEITMGSEQLSKGIYFARLVINGNVYSKKFIVTE